MVVCPSSHILRRVNLCLVVFGCVVCLPFQIKNFAPCKCFAEIHTHTRAQIGCVLKTKKKYCSLDGRDLGGFEGLQFICLLCNSLRVRPLCFYSFLCHFFFVAYQNVRAHLCVCRFACCAQYAFVY